MLDQIHRTTFVEGNYQQFGSPILDGIKTDLSAIHHLFRRFVGQSLDRYVQSPVERPSFLIIRDDFLTVIGRCLIAKVFGQIYWNQVSVAGSQDLLNTQVDHA